MRLPDGLLLSFYGDDYTGAAATMEVMTFAGLPTVLFLDVPTQAQRARFAGTRAIGIAGVARSKTPGWMAENLPRVLHALKAIAAPVAHYKVCSTFDSAPHVGSIGAAIDLAAPLLGGTWHPLVVAAPALGRWQVFGNLFAVADGAAHRLDRHPTMACHPVTPMGEADVRRHLARQTRRAIGLVDVLALQRGEGEAALAAARARGAEIVALDVLDDATLAAAGALIWENRREARLAIGSQGVEYALIAHWRAAGLLPHVAPAPRAAAAARIACVSGSCSPVTAAQIAHAEAHGFAAIALDAVRAIADESWRKELGRAGDAALRALGEGRDPLVYTARGPDDPAVAAVSEAVQASGIAGATVNDRIGAGLGLLLDRVMREGRLTRGVIAGGDTSGHAAQSMGIRALTALAPLAPGSGLSLAHTDDAARPAIEIALKGGQIGAPDFFCAAKRGAAA